MNNIMALVRYSMRPSGLKLCTARIQWVSDSTFADDPPLDPSGD